MKLTNRWNRFIYRLWAPIYDALFDRLFFAPARRRVFPILALQPKERLLLVGIGTGADLLFLPAGVSVVGVDLSPNMLAQARAKISGISQTVHLIQADAERLPLRHQTFEVAGLNLILSVVPDAKTCWQETLRVLRPGSRIIIFDKFLADAASPSLGRRWLGLGAAFLGTDINRRLGDMIGQGQVQVVLDEPSLGRGIYRIILIRKL
jgi:SAM-dependent methyltransferase